MAKTIQQAGGVVDGGVLPTSDEITATTRVAPTQTQAGSKLAGDIMSIMGQGAKTASQGFEISKKAASRVASDNLTELAIGLDAIREKATANPTVENMREAERLNAELYQNIGRKTFDNPDAQHAYDDAYHTVGAKAVSSINTNLEIKSLKLEDAQLYQSENTKLETQLEGANIEFTHNAYNTSVETRTAGGNFTKEQAGKSIVKILNQNIDGVYETLDNLDVYQSNGIDIDNEKLDAEANKYYGSVATIKDGEWTEKEGVPTEVMQSAQNNFNKLIDNNRKAKIEKRNYGFSAIPASYTSTKLDGSTSLADSKQRTISALTELANMKKGSPDLVDDTKFQSLIVTTNKLSLKENLIEQATIYYNKFATGEITYEEYINNVANVPAEGVYDLGGAKEQKFSEVMSKGDADSFLQYQTDRYDDNIRSSNYTEQLTPKKGQKVAVNPYKSAAHLQNKTFGKVKSSYLDNNSKLLQQGVVSGSTISDVQSEYSKTLDYSSSLTVPTTPLWLTKQNRENVNVMFAQQQARVDSGEISAKEAGTTARLYLEGVRNTYNMKSLSIDDQKRTALKEALLVPTAEDITERGVMVVSGGDITYAQGTQKLVVDKFENDSSSTDNVDAIKDYASANMITIRSDKNIFGGVNWLAFRDGVALYTGGDSRITQKKTMAVISTRIGEDMKTLNVDLTGTRTIYRQTTDNSGNIITIVTVKESIGSSPIGVYTFTLDDFAKGVKNITEEQAKK